MALQRIGVAVAVLVVASGPAFARDILWTEKKLYSLYNEELIIRDFFQDRRDGFFVDVGCAYPRKNSNTYYLEKRLGWRGIGVDGLPDYAPSWRQLRPQSKFLNFLVTDHSDTMDAFYRSPVLGLSSAKRDVAERRSGKEITVPSIKLDDLLERNGVTEIDFLNIDVEGSHEEVLGGFDVGRWRPELVCIEEEGLFAVPWFRARGYEPIERYRERDTVNWYFAPRERAVAAQARRSEVGEEEMRKRRLLLEKEPPGSMTRAWYEAKVVLGPDGEPVPRELLIDLADSSTDPGSRPPSD